MQNRHNVLEAAERGRGVRKGLVFAVAALLVWTGAGAGAITYGEPDAGEHPYVGFAIYYVPSETAWFSCSGTLLDADTFLTAGHCVHDIGFDGQDGVPRGGTDVWVTFEETDVLAGFPRRTDYSDPASLYAARRTWLQGNADYTKGTAFPHPKYDNFAEFPVNYDVGVIELDQPADVQAYGRLAGLNAAAIYAGETGAGRNNKLVETVGYGIQSIQPHPTDVESRYKSTSRIVEVNGDASRGGNLHTSNNPSAPGGRGGSCFGDSGGPVFIDNTDRILGVVSYGFSATCHGADYAWRVDTADAYQFLTPYLG